MSALAERIAATPPVAERDPTPGERESFLSSVRSGLSPARAARELPCEWHSSGYRTAGMFGRLANRDVEFSSAYAEAMAERRLVMEDHSDDLVERRANEPDAPAALVLGFAARWNAGFRWRERTRGESVDDVLAGGLPELDPSRFTEGQLDQLRTLLLIGMGRIPNPELEREAIEAGAAA